MSRLTLTFALAVALSAPACARDAQEPPASAFDLLPGKWGWEGSGDCREAPLEMSFTPDKKVLRLSHASVNEAGQRAPRKTTDYTVLAETSNGLSLEKHGEEAKDPAGKPITWNLVVIRPGEYCWQRSDWPKSGCTKSVRRCEI